MSEKTARFVTKITNPITAGLLSSFLIIQKTNLGSQNKIFWFLTVLIIGFLPSLLFLAWQIKKGKINDWYLTARHDRYSVLLITAFSSLTVFLLALNLGVDKLLLSFIAIGLFTNAALFLITLFWKISVHTAAAAILALVLIFIYSSFFVLTFFLVFLIGWARVALRKHTVAQAIAGVLLSTFIFIVIFKLFGFI